MKRWLALFLFASACRTEAPAAPDASEVDSALSFIFADAEPSVLAVPEAGTNAPDERLAPFATAVPRSGKSIGHTSVVFRIDFGDKLRAAYKPESRRGHKRYRGEVAAYRLARALHIPNVPPATVRVFDKATLRAAMMGDARSLSLFDDEVVDRGGHVFGALIPWIDKLELSTLEGPAEKARWKKQLQNGAELVEADRGMAAQISTLIVFDSVTGNWDRWSGGQIGIDRATATLLFLDNDAAFFDPIPPAFGAQMTLLRSVDRFSRSLVDRLRKTDALVIADALESEEPGAPLLPPRAVASVDTRRKDVLAVIDEKIAALGEAAVLFFP